ncbi:SRPBCC family protein [Variovorax sp. IB41]|nr:SRPBCC family protein [Variovorax sp. IB41]
MAVPEFPADRELVFTRLIDAPRANVWRCWTDADLLKRWFAPAPLKVTQAQVDVRPGGISCLTMQLPDGTETPNEGVYLEVIEGRKLVFTDAFTAAWQPKEGAPFMVATITLDDEEGKTRYTACVRHWSTDAARQHENMGFHSGWDACATQLEALASTRLA